MTFSAVAAARPLPARAGLAVRADTLAIAAVALFTLGLAALTWGTWGELDSDTGYDFVAAARLAHGQLPYAHTLYFYGPLAPALLALAALVGGSGLAPFVAAGFAVTLAILAATYSLARTVAGPLAAALATALAAAVAFQPTQFTFVLPHTADATLGTLTLLCALLAIARFAASGRTIWLAAAGAAAGLAALTKPEFAFAAYAGAGAWLALRTLARTAGRREWALLVAPALGIPAVVYGAFLTAVPLHRLVFENLDPKAFLHAAGNTMLKARTPFTISSFAHLGAKLVLYAAGAAALVLLGKALERRGALRTTALAALVGAAALGCVASVANPEALRHALQFAYAWIPAGAVLAALVLVRRFRRRDGQWTPAAQVELAGVVTLAVLAFSTYNGFYAYSFAPQMAVYALPLAAIFLARLHLVELARSRSALAVGVLWLAFLVAAGAGLTLKDARAESGTVRGPGGSLRDEPAKARAYRGALDAILRETRPGAPILLAPQLTWLYTLSGRANPLPETSLLPGALASAADERAAIARLERSNVRFAVIDEHAYTGYGHTSFGHSFDRVLAAWIHHNFVHEATFPSGGGPESPVLQTWVRRT